jgi:hypothetical protein
MSNSNCNHRYPHTLVSYNDKTAKYKCSNCRWILTIERPLRSIEWIGGHMVVNVE